ncbi:trigger factor [Sporomusa sp. KB1]|jgi:trigger factor|uniref:trigger factor n=1 Tax=Sporomusa sp. KB1 TaxID=943346 RepID=UPI0011A22C72|nr:trigger factor [Sporomusa sp. KB1]TWH46523.1 trigger factor [Sporomusa sp. KB1]
MNATLEKVENGEAHLEIIIAADKMEEGLEKSYKKNGKKYNIPGFRNGATPRTILESKFGAEIFLEDALEFVVPNEYYAAIKQFELNIIGEPDIEVGYVKKGKPVSVKVRVPVKPEITLGTLEGLEVKVPKDVEVTEKTIDNYLQNLRSQNKKVIDKANDPAAIGDTVTIDYEGSLQDTTMNQTEKDFKLLLGSGTFFPGFEDKLVGVKKGNKLNVEICFPQDHSLVQLAGKCASFKVTVKKVENIQLRELNDQFAQEVFKLTSLEELRLDSKKKLLEMASQRTSNAKKQAAIHALLDMHPFTVSESIIMSQAKAMLEQFANQLKAQGGSIELYLQMTNSTMDNLKKEIWQDATTITKSNYILEKIIKEKKIEVSDEELNSGIEAFAASIGMATKNAKENLGPLVEKVLFDLKANKAIQYLLDHAVITIADFAA